MIRNVLFDMGNVLVRFAPDVFLGRSGVDDPADRDLLMRTVYRSIEWVRLDRGDLTEEQALAVMYPKLPERLHPAAERLVTHWDRPPLPVAGMEELAEELQQAGYGLYLLTNAGPRHPEYWARFSVARLFPPERVFLSARWHLLKPEAAFFETALKHFGLKAEECLLVDDFPLNVEAAIRCGTDGVVFHGSAALLREELRARGMKVAEAGS